LPSPLPDYGDGKCCHPLFRGVHDHDAQDRHLFALYFFAALALGVFEEVQEQSTSSDPGRSIRVGTILMRAAGLLLHLWNSSDDRLGL
jgi:hypothetical protein